MKRYIVEEGELRELLSERKILYSFFMRDIAKLYRTEEDWADWCKDQRTTTPDVITELLRDYEEYEGGEVVGGEEFEENELYSM